MSAKQVLESAKKEIEGSLLDDNLKTICINAINYQIHTSDLANVLAKYTASCKKIELSDISYVKSE